MLRTLSTLLVVTSALVTGQRPPFAGSRPIGFPELVNRTTTPVPGELGDRFGEGTTQRLPIEANGDRDLIDRLSKLPIDKQPFWFINWQALEEHRKNPQSYPQRPNGFVDAVPQNGILSSNQEFASNPSLINNNQGFVNTNQGFPAQGFSVNNQGFANNNQGVSNNQGFSSNNQGIANTNQGFLSNQGFSNSGFPNPQTSAQNTNRFVNSNNGLSNPNSGFTNSINGFVLTDPALVYTHTENNSGTQNNDNVNSDSNQVFASTSSRPSSNQQIFKIPNHGLTTINQGFSNQNQGLVTPSQSFTKPNKGFSSTSSGFASNVAVSNSNPDINSRFSAQAVSQSTSSNNKVGDANNYSYHWNNTFSNSYKYTYNYTTHSVIRVPQEPGPDHHKQEYHNLN
ncbi:unnamed protein product [Arctia plantaginis]|uniref:Uncharacterized protein n=1 Tax=Arctia plantaginis TaxID=874455 RepID=A0A8S1B5G6_ARCPL|nr:unnamed protein product [Arctia plantaginis]CAB3253213.1 unnamed protein product [Arctia plantaginis]